MKDGRDLILIGVLVFILLFLVNPRVLGMITDTISPITTTTTTIPLTTTIPEGEAMTILCDEWTVNCMLSCKKCPISGYEYCEYSYDSSCNERLEKYGRQTSGRLGPGEKIPWLACSSSGQCILLGKSIEPVSTTTTTVPSQLGCEPVCDKRTVNCMLSCKKCPTDYDYCSYSYDSNCNERLEKYGRQTNGTLQPGESIPWLSCSSSGTCKLEGCYGGAGVPEPEPPPGGGGGGGGGSTLPASSVSTSSTTTTITSTSTTTIPMTTTNSTTTSSTTTTITSTTTTLPPTTTTTIHPTTSTTTTITSTTTTSTTPSTTTTTTTTITTSTTTISSTTTILPTKIVVENLDQRFFTIDVMSNGKTVFAAGGTGDGMGSYIWKNDNEGEGSWTLISNPEPLQWVQSLFIDSRDQIFISSAANNQPTYGLWRSKDNGTTWERVDYDTSGNLIDIGLGGRVMTEDDQGNLYIAQTRYIWKTAVYKSTQNGDRNSWVKVYDNISQNGGTQPYDASKHSHGLIFEPNSKYLYFLGGEPGSQSHLTRSKNYGQDWETLYQPGFTMMGLGVRNKGSYNEVYFGSDNYGSNFEDRLFRLIDDGQPSYEVEEVLPLYSIADPDGIRMTMIPFWITPSPDNEYIFMGGSERKNWKDKGTTRVGVWYSKTGDVYDGTNWNYTADYLVIQNSFQGRFWVAHHWTKNGWLLVGTFENERNGMRICTSCP